MLPGQADSATLGYLGRALSLELSAVQLYSTQARIVEVWGLSDIAAKLSNEASEEMAHADRIIGRMIALGVVPNASQLRPVRLGSNVHELLRYNYEFENEVISLYTKAKEHCAFVGDNDSRLFFEGLLAEEQAHAQSIAQWMNQINQPK
ncbi:MAG: bacterioferritin [Gammaproteobacteria bacterium]|nr:bacterioferritin [Gammaproteobacteria bacterium]